MELSSEFQQNFQSANSNSNFLSESVQIRQNFQIDNQSWIQIWPFPKPRSVRLPNLFNLIWIKTFSRSKTEFGNSEANPIWIRIWFDSNAEEFCWYFCWLAHSLSFASLTIVSEQAHYFVGLRLTFACHYLCLKKFADIFGLRPTFSCRKAMPRCTQLHPRQGSLFALTLLAFYFFRPTFFLVNWSENRPKS